MPFFAELRMFLGAREFTDVDADFMLDERSLSHSSSSSSSRSSSSRLGSESDGTTASARSIAPQSSSTASNSIAYESVVLSKGDNIDKILTFLYSLSLPTPSNQLVENFSLPVDDNHWHSDVGEVGYTLVANDGHEFGLRILGCKCPYVIKGSIAPRKSNAIDKSLPKKDRRCVTYPSL